MNKYIAKELITEFFKFNGLLLHDKCYKVAFYFVLLFISIVLFSLTDPEQIPNNYIFKIISSYIIWLLFILSSIAYISESIYFYQKKIINLFRNIFFNFFVGILIFLVYVYSEFRIGIFINDITGLDSSLLPNAYMPLKIIFIPYTWSIVLLPLLFINVFIRTHQPKLTKDKNEDVINNNNVSIPTYEKVKLFIGILGGLIVFFIAASFSMHVNTKNSSLYNIGKKIIIYSEYYKKSQCKNHSYEEHIANIGRGEISIYNPNLKGDKQFRVEKCEIGEILRKQS